jgi:diaminopimelate decarboxylase
VIPVGCSPGNIEILAEPGRSLVAAAVVSAAGIIGGAVQGGETCWDTDGLLCSDNMGAHSSASAMSFNDFPLAELVHVNE